MDLATYKPGMPAAQKKQRPLQTYEDTREVTEPPLPHIVLVSASEQQQQQTHAPRRRSMGVFSRGGAGWMAFCNAGPTSTSSSGRSLANSWRVRSAATACAAMAPLRRRLPRQTPPRPASPSVPQAPAPVSSSAPPSQTTTTRPAARYPSPRATSWLRERRLRAAVPPGHALPLPPPAGRSRRHPGGPHLARCAARRARRPAAAAPPPRPAWTPAPRPRGAARPAPARPGPPAARPAAARAARWPCAGVLWE